MHSWATFEFNMIELSDDICEASSMMPQKKSPCVFEEIRSTLGKVVGCYTDIVCRAQNTMYGDTIEVFQSSEDVPKTVAEVLKAVNLFTKVLDNLTVKQDVMLSHAQRGFSTATELAAILFRRAGIPLRVAHAIVGEAVRAVWEKGRTASDITTEVVNEAATKVIRQPLNLEPQVLAAALDPVRFVEAHKSQGAVAPAEVQRMVEIRRDELREAHERQAERLEYLESADKELQEAVKGILAS
jgi:argininosuccinate lyase